MFNDKLKMVPEGPPAPLGGGQPVVPSMLRANSGLLGGHGGSLPSQNAFPSLVSPRDQFSSMHMIESVPNVSSLLHQSFANGAPSFNLSYGSSQMGLIDGGAESGPLSRVGNGTGFNQPYSSFMSSPTALNPNSSSQVQAQQQFSNLTDQQQAQQQQQQHLLQSRKPSGAAAAAQILHQQRFMQIQPQKLLKSMPQQRSPLQPQFQLQNMLVRSPVRPVYEPGMCARRLTQYMYQQQHRPEDNNIEFWRRFVAEYFAPSAKKKWCVSMYGSGRPTTGVSAKDVWHCQICNCKPGRGLEATAEVLPRLFKIKYESGTLEELLYVDTPREYHNFSGQIVLDYAKAIQESVFGQVRVVRDGQLRIVFSQDLKICSWEFCARRHEELIPRRLLIPQVNQHGAPSSTPGSEQQNNCNMFVASACQLAKAQEVPVVNDFGYTKRYMRCLQISQVVNSMKDLMDYGSETGTGPRESLAKFLHRIKPEFQNKPQQKESQLQQQQQQQQQQQIMVQNTSNPAQAAANNPYGGNSMQMPPPDSSSTLPQTQPTISPFQSATPPSSHNPLPAPDGGLSGALVNQQEDLGNQLLLDGLWTVDGLYDLLFEGESSA